MESPMGRVKMGKARVPGMVAVLQAVHLLPRATHAARHRAAAAARRAGEAAVGTPHLLHHLHQAVAAGVAVADRTRTSVVRRIPVVAVEAAADPEDRAPGLRVAVAVARQNLMKSFLLPRLVEKKRTSLSRNKCLKAAW